MNHQCFGFGLISWRHLLLIYLIFISIIFPNMCCHVNEKWKWKTWNRSWFLLLNLKFCVISGITERLLWSGFMMQNANLSSLAKFFWLTLKIIMRGNTDSGWSTSLTYGDKSLSMSRNCYEKTWGITRPGIIAILWSTIHLISLMRLWSEKSSEFPTFL